MTSLVVRSNLPLSISAGRADMWLSFVYVGRGLKTRTRTTT
jgi:hypothetical protein